MKIRTVLPFLILIFTVSPVIAKEYPRVTPNFYTCAPDMCNSCTFQLSGITYPLIFTVPDVACTELGCASTPEIDALYRKCSRDWRYSKNIRFKDLSNMENACVNGVRNHNYWDESFPRETYDKNYAFAQCLEAHHRLYEERYSKRVSDLCQDGWQDYVPSEHEIFFKHAEESAFYAHYMCTGYFESLEREFGLSRNELGVLARYISSRQFPYFDGRTPQTLVSGKKINDIDILDNIFTLLEERKWVNLKMVVMPSMVDAFREDYQSVTSQDP